MDGLMRRRRLPHWDVEAASYFVTCCLAGSISAQGLRDLNRYRAQLDARPRPETMDPFQWNRHKQKLLFLRVDEYLDHQPAVTHLRRPEVAEVVRDSFLHFAGERYVLRAYVVMPSHFHWLFRPIDTWCETLRPTRRAQTPRERIMRSLKTYTARRCNQLLGKRGKFWQDESYDHWIEDDDEQSLARVVHYIEQNPVRAGLVARAEDWPFSSAAQRAGSGIITSD